MKNKTIALAIREETNCRFRHVHGFRGYTMIHDDDPILSESLEPRADVDVRKEVEGNALTYSVPPVAVLTALAAATSALACVVCHSAAPKYRCPKCFRRYCSAVCCKAHKEERGGEPSLCQAALTSGAPPITAQSVAKAIKPPPLHLAPNVTDSEDLAQLQQELASRLLSDAQKRALASDHGIATTLRGKRLRDDIWYILTGQTSSPHTINDDVGDKEIRDDSYGTCGDASSTAAGVAAARAALSSPDIRARQKRLRQLRQTKPEFEAFAVAVLLVLGEASEEGGGSTRVPILRGLPSEAEVETKPEAEMGHFGTPATEGNNSEAIQHEQAARSLLPLLDYASNEDSDEDEGRS
jgi:hypothetical protein